MLLDTPKQGGGNTNDGNSARRFFRDVDTTSNITGIDRRLVERISIILRVLSSGYSINLSMFETYVEETARLYVELYNWYNMPVTVHKIFIHSPAIVQHFLIPIGQLSEDVQELRHKEMKKFRESFTRKTHRAATNQDIMNRLLITSDPLINSLRPLQEKTVQLSQIARQLVLDYPELD